MGLIKFFTVDLVAFIIDDLRKQSIVMWIFIGWGWLAILVMIASIATG